LPEEEFFPFYEIEGLTEAQIAESNNIHSGFSQI